MGTASRTAGFLLSLCLAGVLYSCGPVQGRISPCASPGVYPSGVPTCPLTSQQARALPDAQIFYPGSQVVSKSGWDLSSNVSGEPEDAMAGQHRGFGGRRFEHRSVFAVAPPKSVYREILTLDFRYQAPAVSGTNYSLRFEVVSL